MTDTKTLAYINMYAVLGTLENLCELDDKAKEILSGLKKPVGDLIVVTLVFAFVTMLSTDLLQQLNLQRAAAVWKTE